MSTSTLENGVYTITNNARDRQIGRFPIEELTLLPKPLMALPQGVEGPNVRIEGILSFLLTTSCNSKP